MAETIQEPIDNSFDLSHQNSTEMRDQPNEDAVFDNEPQEMEFNEQDIVGYLVDENDNEIGIVVLEDGQEVEYYYEEDTEDGEAIDSEELEFDEDSIVGYIVDENDKEIGLIVMEDDNEVEYYYAEEKPTATKSKAKNEYDLGITREGVASATKDVNAIARDGIKVANEFKGAFDDIKSALDFKSILK